MNRSQRIIAISLIAILLLMGFAIGRLTKSTDKVEAEGNALVASSVTRQSAPASANETNDRESNFYLSDFKVGYNDGYKAGLNGQNGAYPETSRSGYNDGYKQGYSDALQNQAVVNQAPEGTSTEPPSRAASVARASSERVVYRTVTRPVYHSYVSTQPHHSSKLKKVLTIAAPAAVGAGLGALFGGKKGAGVGALLGGGGGAFYLLSRRHHD